MSELWLRIEEPNEEPLHVVLDGESMLGRDFRCDVVVHDDAASRMHARLGVDDEGWWIVDLATTNGTKVNGERIEGPTRLQIGDMISVGRACGVVIEPL